MRPAAPLLVLLAILPPHLAGCARQVRVTSPPSGRGDGNGVEVVVGETGRAWKKVVAKQEPSLLLAEDGTGCDVSAERFRDTPVGTMIECDWRATPPR